MPHYKITENGESIFHIVVHQYADETIRYAASELQKYLLKSTNAAIPYFSDRCDMRSPEIRIGPNVRGKSEVPTKLCAEEGFCIYGKEEHIYITGNSSRGVLYGVYYFLERFCGFACFTKYAEKIDTHPCLEIELDEICVEPAFEFRDTYFRFAFDGDFCAKNRSNTSLGDISVAKGGRMKWFNFHHSFYDLVPASEYFENHPEYFSEIEGVRDGAKSQLCLTNPDVAKIAEDTLRRWIRENPECRVFSVAQNDNERRCTCKNCLALEEKEGSPAGPIIHFVNRLADAIKEDYPHILLHTFAYQYTLPAPKHVIARDNVIVRLCSGSCRFDRPMKERAITPHTPEAKFVQALYDWKAHASRIYVWDYAVNFYNYLQPYVHLHTLQKNVQFFKELGVKGVLEQGNFAYGGGAACDDLKAYIISRLLWDPYIDVDQEIHHFCQTVYGPLAGDKIEQYVSLVMAACEGAPLTIRQPVDAENITDELIKKAEALFEEALALVKNEELRERISREYLSVRFLRLARQPLDTPDHEKLVDEFFNDIKHHGITEIRERRSLAFSKQVMLGKKPTEGYSLYYIMR